MTSLYIHHANNSDDVTSLCSRQFSTLVGVHFYHTTDTFSLASVGVEDGVTLVQYTGVDADKGQGAETVVHDLKCQSA